MVKARRDGTSSSSTTSDRRARGRCSSTPGQLEAEVLKLRRALDALPIGVVLADPTGHATVENIAARTHHGHAAVLVEEAVERHVRRAVRGHASGRRSSSSGRRARCWPCTPSRWRMAARSYDRRRQRAGPARCRANRLRRQHQPRAEDAGRGARVLAETLADRTTRRPSAALADKMVGEAHRVAGPSTICWSCRAPSSAAAAALTSSRLRRSSTMPSTRVRPPPSITRSGRASTSHGPSDLHVLGSHRQLVSAVANLLENAVKYSDTGSRGRRRLAMRDGWIEIIVTDTRVGHPAARHRPDLRALLPCRPGTQPRYRWHRTRACRSCATSPPTIPVRSRCSPARAKAPSSRIRIPIEAGDSMTHATRGARRRGRAELRRGA